MYKIYKDDKGGVEGTRNSYRVVNHVSHMCGLMGYDPWLGDTCPGCENGRRLREEFYKLFPEAC